MGIIRGIGTLASSDVEISLEWIARDRQPAMPCNKIVPAWN